MIQGNLTVMNIIQSSQKVWIGLKEKREEKEGGLEKQRRMGEGMRGILT